MKKRIAILYVLLLTPYLLFAQKDKELQNKYDTLISKAAQFGDVPDSMLYYYGRAEKLAESNNDSSLLADIWLKLGDFYYSEGSYRKSIDFSSRAKKTFLKLNDTIRAGWAGYYIGIAYKYWGKYSEAQQEIQKDIKLFEKKNNLSGVSNCYIVAGYINQAWHNYDEAERICRITLKMSTELNSKSGIGFSLLAIGNSFAAKNSYDSAYFYFQKALKNFTDIKSDYGIALTYRDIGSFYIYKGEISKSLSYFQKSLDLLKKSSNNRGISELYALMGEAYYKQGDYVRAIEFLQSSQNIALKMELNEDIVNNYKTISEVYESEGRKDFAFDYHKKYTSLKDSIFNEEKHFQIAELQTQYETEKKEQQIKLQDIQLEKARSVLRLQRYLTIAFIFAFILAAAIAILSFRWYKIKKRDNQILFEQKKIIERKNTLITDSINYAQRIQGVLLGKSTIMPKPIKEIFYYYQPKDIVSGDFYYIKELDNYVVAAVADCTGHGVPGAFMSMLGMTLLNEIFSHSHPLTAAEVLENLRFKVKEALNQTVFKTETKDGMDIALCLIDKKNNQVQYAGAYNPLVLLRNNELIEYKATRNPVGIHIKEFPFENTIINTQANDIFYIFSDGYSDQVGGLAMQKFRIGEFKKLLLEIHGQPLNEQPAILQKRIDLWKMGNDQTDDMLVVGFKL